jgi:hypothetical protein
VRSSHPLTPKAPLLQRLIDEPLECRNISRNSLHRVLQSARGLARRKGQRHVDPGRDTGRSDDLALDHDAFGNRLRAELAKVIPDCPVRVRALALQHSGRAKEQRARADSRRPFCGLVRLANPLYGGRIVEKRHALPDPGMMITSGWGTSSSEEVAVSTRPSSVVFGPGVVATNLISASGSRERTS